MRRDQRASSGAVPATRAERLKPAAQAVTWTLPTIACLLIGGAPWPVVIALLALALPLLLLDLSHRSRPRLAFAVAIAVGALAWETLQLLSLPVGLLARIDPTSAGLVADAAAAAGVSVAAHSASLAPGDTALAIGRLALFVVALFGASLATRRDDTGDRFFGAVVVAGGAVALCVAAHAALGMDSIYGLVAARGRGVSRVLGPFVNSNHLAAFSCAVVPVAVAVGVSKAGKARIAALCVAGALGLVALLTLSRTAILALPLGLVILGLGTLVTRRLRPRAAGLTLGGVLAAFAAVTVGTGPRLRSLFSPDVLFGLDARWRVWGEALEMSAAHRWVGVGAGAFRSAWWTHRSGPSDTSAQDAESLYLQTLAVLGAPMTVLLLLGAVIVGLQVTRHALDEARGGDLAPLGAVAALLTLGVTESAMLATSQPAIAVLIAWLVGGLVGRCGWAPKLPRGASLVLGLGGFCLGVAATSWGSARALPATDAWFSAALVADAEGREAGDPLPIALLHPADPYGFAWSAILTASAPASRAPELLNRALLLDPYGAEPHRAAVSVLRSAGLTTQARLEARLALSLATRKELPRFVADALRLWPEEADRLALLPAASDRAARVAAEFERQAGWRLGLPAWLVLARRVPPVPEALGPVVRLLPAGEVAQGLVLVREAILHRPTEPVWGLYEGLLLLRGGQTEEGEAALRPVLAAPGALSDTERGHGLLSLGRALRAEATRFEALLALPSAGGASEEAARAWIEGHTLEARGSLSPAVRAFGRAVALRPEASFYRDELAAFHARSDAAP